MVICPSPEHAFALRRFVDALFQYELSPTGLTDVRFSFWRGLTKRTRCSCSTQLWQQGAATTGASPAMQRIASVVSPDVLLQT